MIINFCTTAMPRPELMKLTYESFSKKLSGVDLGEQTLFLNIDPTPTDGISDVIKATREVAESYFGNVVVRVPEEPNFTAAVDWCWATADTEFIFHLEDDWELRQVVEVDKVVEQMRDGRKKQAILRAYNHNHNKMALSPSIIHRDYYKRFSGDFDYSLNPEIQLRKPFVKKEEIIVAGKGIIVFDLGREWLKTQPFKRPAVKGNFTAWEKK